MLLNNKVQKQIHGLKASGHQLGYVYTAQGCNIFTL